VTELDRILEHRAAVLQALKDELCPPWNPNKLQALQKEVESASRMCEHLDRAMGLSRNRLWPTKAQTPGDASILLQSYFARFVDLITHLRAVHRFCQFQGQAYNHPAELEALSSIGMVRERLLQALSRSSCQQQHSVPHTAIESAIDAKMDIAEDVDPLDAYMAKIEAELHGTSESGPSSRPFGSGIKRPVHETSSSGNQDVTKPNQGLAAAVDKSRVIQDPALSCRAGPMDIKHCSPFPLGNAHSRDNLSSIDGPQTALRVPAKAPLMDKPSTSLVKFAGGQVVHLSNGTNHVQGMCEVQLQNNLLGDLPSDESDLDMN